MTVGEYARHQRVQHTCQLIAERPNMPLCWIAVEAGFADQSHLTRWFRRYYGLTPGAYQRCGCLRFRGGQE